jgi:hypothetical protein
MEEAGKWGRGQIEPERLEHSKWLKCRNNLDFLDDLLTPPSTGSTGYVTLIDDLLNNNHASLLIFRRRKWIDMIVDS